MKKIEIGDNLFLLIIIILFFFVPIALLSNDCKAYPLSEISEQTVSDEICLYQTGLTPENITGFYNSKSKTIYLTRTSDYKSLWHERGHALCDHYCTKEDLELFKIEGCKDKAYYENGKFNAENYKCSTQEQFAKEFALYMLGERTDKKKVLFFNELLEQ